MMKPALFKPQYAEYVHQRCQYQDKCATRAEAVEEGWDQASKDMKADWRRESLVMMLGTHYKKVAFLAYN